jgi:methylenetetrahydrofolate dehydrogenase (NADP+)/methenyltetrahydrofolate cyclohydrolase
MAKLLDGKQVADALNEKLKAEVKALGEKGVTPTLAIVRVGERGDDIAYENGAVKRCGKIGVAVKKFLLDKQVSQDGLIDVIKQINQDPGINGCLLFRPLPGHIDGEAARNSLDPQKDVDSITDASLAGVFAESGNGFAPCTAQACMEILDYYDVNPSGKKVAVIGRSLVIGKPVALLLLSRHATVTICHTRTVDMQTICRSSEILIASAGRPKIVGADCLSPGQIIIDVGINMLPDGGMCGDVDFDAAQNVVDAISPVPGGVGAVTTSVLVSHVIQAAKKSLGFTV